MQDRSLSDKVRVEKLDAVNIEKLGKKFDFIITTWFTGGNFFPYDFSFEVNKDGIVKNKPDLSINQKFRDIFQKAYSLLNPNGEIILGSIYRDTDKTRIRQESFYKKSGMTIITEPSDSFVATKEGFWSQRFTQEKVYQYFDWIDPKKITIIPLDTYDYALMVRVKK